MNIFKTMTGERARVKNAWDAVKKNWFLALAHKFILIFFALSMGLLLWRWRMLPPLLPLWYSRPWGADQLASPYWLLLLPLMSLTIYGVNFLVAMYIMAEYLIFTQMLFLSSLVVSLLSFVALMKILFLIT